jgi:hypothetical protein
MTAIASLNRPSAAPRPPGQLPTDIDRTESPRPVPDRVANALLDFLHDFTRNTRSFLSGERTVANRADMVMKIAPLIREQLQSGNSVAGINLRASGTGPSIVFSDGFAMSVHEIPAMARLAGMPRGSTLVLVRDGMSGVLSTNGYDTYQQFVWASRNTGLRIVVHSDDKVWVFTPNMNSRPSW